MIQYVIRIEIVDPLCYTLQHPVCPDQPPVLICTQSLLIKAGSSDSQLSLSRRMSHDINSAPTNQSGQLTRGTQETETTVAL